MAKIHPYNLDTVFRLRNRLVQDVCLPYYNCSLEGDAFQEFVETIWKALPAGIGLAVVFESLRGIAGVELDMPRLEATMWRIAGNVRTLKEGVPSYEWAAQSGSEWVPLQIVGANPHINQRKQRGYMFMFRALAGTPCPLHIYRFWSRATCSVAASHVGFSTRRGNYPYSHPRQLVGLRLYGQVTPKLSTNGPGFYKIEAPPSCHRYNRDVLGIRLGQHPETCPRNYSHECHRCVIGYVNCLAGTHREDYIHKVCPACGRLAVFDSGSRSSQCVPCDEAYRRTGNEQNTTSAARAARDAGALPRDAESARDSQPGDPGITRQDAHGGGV